MSAHPTVSRATAKVVSDIDQLKADTYGFFEALAADLTQSYSALDARLAGVESSLAAAGGGGAGCGSSDDGLSSPPRAMHATSPPRSALELARRLRDGNAVGFSFDALLQEVEREQEIVVEDQRRARAEEQLRHASGSHATPPSAGSGVPIQAHGTTQHPGVSLRARGGDLDASDTSFSATPVRRSHKAAPSAPASPSHPSTSQHATPSRPMYGGAGGGGDGMMMVSGGGSPSDGGGRRSLGATYSSSGPGSGGVDDSRGGYPSAHQHHQYMQQMPTTPLQSTSHGHSNHHQHMQQQTPTQFSTPSRYSDPMGAASSSPASQHHQSAAAAMPRGNINQMQPTSVLVEFKRQRVLQYESDFYAAPGEHVVVGGDRGEDIGLVTYAWTTGGPNGTSAPPTPFKSREQGAGKVLRVASSMEVGQLQGVQAELEKRAKEVAQLKVQEHQLPMAIVDAEYQFDRKKLTFFYQSQHRLDFRVLVRDLYKTFRARIWMELV